MDTISVLLINAEGTIAWVDIDKAATLQELYGLIDTSMVTVANVNGLDMWMSDDFDVASMEVNMIASSLVGQPVRGHVVIAGVTSAGNMKSPATVATERLVKGAQIIDRSPAFTVGLIDSARKAGNWHDDSTSVRTC